MSVFNSFSKVFQNVNKTSVSRIINNTIIRNGSLWEPSYFEEAKKRVPEYDIVDVQLKSRDYPLLENYQKLVHRIAKGFDIPVSNCYAVPNQYYKVTKFKHNSNITESEYHLKTYERVVQLCDVKSTILPIFIDAVITACPPGVKISIHEHTPELEENRYVPEYEVINLEKEKILLDEKLKEAR